MSKYGGGRNPEGRSAHLSWLQSRMAGSVPPGVIPYRDPGTGAPPLRRVTLTELCAHRAPDDLWLCIKGQVYDCTAYSKVHPGGLTSLVNSTGKDSTAVFMKVHPYVNLDTLLGPPFHVGELDLDDGHPTGLVRGGRGNGGASNNDDDDDDDEEEEEDGGGSEPPWVTLLRVRPLGSREPPSTHSHPPQRYPLLPSIRSRTALRGGALVLWRERQGQQHHHLCAAWPWGFVVGDGRRGGGSPTQLLLIARGPTALSAVLTALAPILFNPSTTAAATAAAVTAAAAAAAATPVILVWDMRGGRGEGEAAVREARGAFEEVVGKGGGGVVGRVLLDTATTAPDASSSSSSSSIIDWEECCKGVTVLTSMKDCLPPPHEALIVVGVGGVVVPPQGEGGSVSDDASPAVGAVAAAAVTALEWEEEWDNALRDAYFASELLFGV